KHREEYHGGHERPEHRRQQVVERLSKALVVAYYGTANVCKYLAHVDLGAYAAQLDEQVLCPACRGIRSGVAGVHDENVKRLDSRGNRVPQEREEREQQYV